MIINHIEVISWDIQLLQELLSTGNQITLSAPSIKEVDCFDEWKFFACHYSNGSSQIQFIGFDHYYSPMAHADSLKINIAIAATHIINTRVLNTSNAFQNFPIYERVSFSPPPYYLDWFEISYPNVTINLDDDPFCLQCIYGI